MTVDPDDWSAWPGPICFGVSNGLSVGSIMVGGRQQRQSGRDEYREPRWPSYGPISIAAEPDKAAAIDHAAAPLGTDEEAAETPVPAEVVAEVRNYECARSAAKAQRPLVDLRRSGPLPWSHLLPDY